MYLNEKFVSATLLAILTLGGPGVFGPQLSDKRPITVEDCVRTRRVVSDEVKMSVDGKQLAYVVKAPDVETNRNRYRLYVRPLDERGPRDNGQILLEADRLSGIHWLDEDRLVARAEQKEGDITTDRLFFFDLSSEARETIDCPPGTEDYSITPDGRTIAFSIITSANGQAGGAAATISLDQQLRGYEVPFQKNPTFLSPADSEIEIYRRTGKGAFEITKVSFTGAQDSGMRSTLSDIDQPNLSPDGRYLLFRYMTNNLPRGWEEEPIIRQFRAMRSPGALYVLGLCDLNSGRTRMAFNFSAGLISATAWAGDSRSYAVVSPSPFGSGEGDREEKEAADSGSVYFYLYRFAHVFAIDVVTGQVTRVLRRDSGTPGDTLFGTDGPLAWNSSGGGLLLRSGMNEFVRMSCKNGSWFEGERFEFTEDGRIGSSFTSNGEMLAGVSQSPNASPDILVLRLHSGSRTLLTDLNPEYEHIALGQVAALHWRNRYGSRCVGELIRPVGYEQGQRYPFVFMATSSGQAFITDTPYTTAFAPQSLANAGFVVLLAKYPLENRVPERRYAGTMSEAYNWMSMVESAIDRLSRDGLIDRNRVGLVGFSRTSWLTDFVLSHSSYRFRAASSADGEDYTYTGYTRFLDMGFLLGYEAEIGGPPYGRTLKNWLDYTVPFNARRIHAPVLMEYTRIEVAYELFTMLNRQRKPVELYFYPQGQHPLNTPLERINSLQRNVDWFRFWMQGYERTDPADTTQYARWRMLRAKGEARDRVAATHDRDF